MKIRDRQSQSSPLRDTDLKTGKGEGVARISHATGTEEAALYRGKASAKRKPIDARASKG